MAVAADLDVGPTLDEVREFAREHTLVPLRHTFIDDIETPVSAYLKLRGEGPSFLLESAEQEEKIGRYSFMGCDPDFIFRIWRQYDRITDRLGKSLASIPSVFYEKRARIFSRRR